MFEREMFARIAETLPGPHREQRAVVMGVQLAGVVFARYILRMEPVGSISVDELVRHLLPGLHAVLHPTPGRRTRQ